MASVRLRARSATAPASSSPTLRFQVPSPSTLGSLKSVLSSLTSLPSDQIKISLNKKDDILANPSTPLIDLGITSGDLVYYSVSPELASAAEIPQDRGFSSCLAGIESVGAGARRELCARAASQRAGLFALHNFDTAIASTSGSTGYASMEITEEATSKMQEESTQLEQSEEISGMQEGAEAPRFSIPDFLHRVLDAENGNIRNQHHLLVLAVHGVMLETGFVLSPKAESETGQTAMDYQNSYCYTLPRFLKMSNNRPEINLKFVELGEFLVVYGSICSQVRRMDLLVSRWINAQAEGTLEDAFPHLFELWNQVKDNMSIPTLTWLCESAKLPLPSSFCLLPCDLKMKILELLTAISLARVACVSSEIRFLASAETLWRKKCFEELGWLEDRAPSSLGWRRTFVQEWLCRKERDRRPVMHERRRPFRFHFRQPPMRPYPGILPGFIGGDYDLYPGGLGGPPRPGFLGGLPHHGDQPRGGHLIGPRFVIGGSPSALASSIGSGRLDRTQDEHFGDPARPGRVHGVYFPRI